MDELTDMKDLTDTADGPAASVQVRRDDGIPVITLCGELDLSSTERIQAEVEEEIGENERRIIFDVADLQYMDSSGIALLITIARRAPDVELRRPADIVRRIIEISGLDQVLRMTP